MRRNRTLVVLALAVLVTGAGAAAALGSTSPAATEQSNDDGRTIAVGASGSAETAPDQAVLRVAVVTTGDSADEVRRDLAENVSAMRTALSDAGVADDQVRTARYDISQNHERRENPDARAYRALHSFQVTLDDTGDLGRVIDAAVENGATRVDGVRFTLSTEERREVRQRALEDATADARGQAETLAAASDLEIAGVESVSTVDRGHGPVYREAAVSAGDSGTAVESGPVSVTVEVQVTYEATSA